MSIRIDCYLAKLKSYKNMYPDAVFKVITRTAKSPLAPSRQLLDKSKKEKMDFQTYKKYFLFEKNKQKRDKTEEGLKFMRELNEIVDLYEQGKTIFLVCYEKKPSICHRSIIKELAEILIEKRREGRKAT